MKNPPRTKRWKLIFFGIQTFLIGILWLGVFSALAKIQFPVALMLVVTLLVCQILFVTIVIALYKPWRDVWPLVLFTPFTPWMIYWEELSILSFLRKSRARQNVPSEAVVFLAYPDWTTWEAWVKPHYTIDELRALEEHLTAKGQQHSYYTIASLDDVKMIMADGSVKEVYFLGHGSTVCFALSNETLVRYKDFDAERHGKEYVHQIHCGRKQGRSLIDRVVPKENRAKCFFYRKEIDQKFITAEFNRRTKKVAADLSHAQ